MVGFKPSLSAQKIMLCYQEDYIFGPVNLPWKPKVGSAGPGALVKLSLTRAPEPTSEMGSECQQQPHGLAICRVWATGYSKYQGLGAGSTWCPEDAIHIGT